MSKRVAVLLGGMSPEREVSLKSGHAVAAALRSRGHDVVEIDVGPDLPERLRAEKVEVAWIALHGVFGEDGCVQGLLEIMRIPYTGSSAHSSAIAIDKIATKRRLRFSEVPMLADAVWRKGEPLPGVPYPVVVKTPSGGSTIGVYMCDDSYELKRALEACTQWDDEVLIETKMAGEEVTVAVLEGEVLPVIAIRPVEGFFDFEAKYTEGRTEYLVPAPIAPEIAEKVQRHALKVWDVLRLSGIARADFIVDARGYPWFLEINTIPGMTATSLSPMAAAAAGVSFEELVERLLLSARLHVTPAR